MTWCGMYWLRQWSTGGIVSCWWQVYSKGLVWERDDRGVVWIVSQERENRVVRSWLHMFTLFHPLALCSTTLSICVQHPVPVFVFLSHALCLQKLLFSLGGSFLYYADHFKLYSGFCANHIKVQKVLERGTTHTYIYCCEKVCSSPFFCPPCCGLTLNRPVMLENHPM